MSQTASPLSGPKTLCVSAREPWNATGLLLEAGRAYDFTAEGSWRDASIVCDAAGYRSDGGDPRPLSPRALSPLQAFILQRFEGYRRMPAPWFALIGAIDEDIASAFVIGRAAARVKMPKTGMLTCFANDVPFMYWNNRGCLALTVAPSDPAQP